VSENQYLTRFNDHQQCFSDEGFFSNGEMIQLHSLLGSSEGTIESASIKKINNQGTILCSGKISGKNHFFLLHQHEPTP
jgi:hypothetical protein